MAKKYISKVFFFLLKLALSVLLVVLMVKFAKLDLKHTFERLKQTQVLWLGVTAFFYTSMIFSNTYRWMKLANLLNYKLKYAHALRIYFETVFANNFIPSNLGGDLIRAYDLMKKNPDTTEVSTNSKSFLRAASTVMIERIFGFMMMFFLLPVGLISLHFSEWGESFPKQIELVLWLSFFGTLFSFAFYKILKRIPWGPCQKIVFAIKEYTTCKKSLLIVAFWTFVTHIFFLLGNIASGLALGLDFTHIPFWYWFIITPAATLISFVIPAVKGVGAKEASYVYFLGLIGVNSNDALAIAFIAFIATLICSLPGASIAFRKLENKGKG